MSSAELDNRNIAVSMRKSVENLVISSQDAIGQSINQALTFSGVISQQTAQMFQETRSISRSPSPALRNVPEHTQIDYNDLEKVDCQVSGDGSNISVGSDIAANIILRGDGKSSAQLKSLDGSGRSKKKSWYSSLYPTYKSRSDDFKKLFKDIPDDERLIVDYSCALQKDILAQGRLYASQNYLCFYANIFGWETNVTMRWKDVTAITKEKTARVIPNAILVCTEVEKHFFASFTGRDKTYLMLFRIWQNALMDQPMSTHEIWQWVRSCYGEELGFNSDDEGYSRDLEDDKVSALPEDLAETSSLEIGAGESREDIRSGRRSRQDNMSVTNGDVAYNEDELGDTLPTDMSDTSDSDPDKHHNASSTEKCSCVHDGRLFLQQQFAINIDQMFTQMFTNSKLYLELMTARNSRDLVQNDWQDNPDTGKRCRQISYTLALSSGLMGPKEVCVTETQVMNTCTKPGLLYSIDVVSDNARIPYADYFYVEMHYCLQKVTENVTSLQLYGQIKYKKTPIALAKGFLEKNTTSGLEEYARLLENILLAEAEGGAPLKKKGRRRRRATSSTIEPPTAVIKSPVIIPRASISRPLEAPRYRPRLTDLVVCLLIINILLWCFWFYLVERPQVFDMDDLQDRLASQSSEQLAQWSALLEQHAERRHTELRTWRQALNSAQEHLQRTEQVIAKLLETIKPSLERAQEDAEKHVEL